MGQGNRRRQGIPESERAMKYGECLKNLWKAAATEESRYTIQAVKIDADKKVAVATDGHMLCIIDVTTLLEPDEKSFLIPVEALKASRQLYLAERARFRTKIQKDRDVRPVFIRATEEAVTVFIGSSKRGQSFELTTGIYPDWQAVAKAPQGYKHSITLSVGLLLRLAEAMRGNSHAVDGVGLLVKTENDPVLVTLPHTSDTKTYGMLMPMRMGDVRVNRFWVPKK